MCERMQGLRSGRAARPDRGVPRAHRAELRRRPRPGAAIDARASASTICGAPTCRASSGRRARRLFPAVARCSKASRPRSTGSVSISGRSPASCSTSSTRPKKSPRAFCAPVRVPGEVYLVLSPVGGRDDFSVLFHEAGHAEHYANVDPSTAVRVPPSRRQRDHRVLRVPLPGPGRGPRVACATPWDRATPRRSPATPARTGSCTCAATAAKLAYELELHGDGRAVIGDGTRSRPATRELLGGALGIDVAVADVPRRRRPGLLLRLLPARLGARDTSAPLPP